MDSGNKVCHFVTHYYPCLGGIESVVKNFAEHTKNFNASVVCLNKCSKSNLKIAPKKEIVSNVMVERHSFAEFFSYKFSPGIIKHFFGKKILHVHGLGFFLDSAVLLKPFHRNKIVLSTHGGIFHTKKNLLLKKFYFEKWAKFLLSFVDVVLASSEHDLKVFSKICSKKKLLLLENPVQTGKPVLRKKKENQFLFVGRLSKNKQIELLFEALKNSGKKNIVLKIAGPDFDFLREKLIKTAKMFPEIRTEFLGIVSEKELENLYIESDFFVSASRYEGFGLTVIEAMSYGCIPILNSIPSFKRFVKQSKSGFLTNFSDPVLAGKTIKTSLNLTRKQKNLLRKRAFEYASSFSPEKKALELEKTYFALKDGLK